MGTRPCAGDASSNWVAPRLCIMHFLLRGAGKCVTVGRSVSSCVPGRFCIQCMQPSLVTLHPGSIIFQFPSFSVFYTALPKFTK
jgi:hypothetical protein